MNLCPVLAFFKIICRNNFQLQRRDKYSGKVVEEREDGEKYNTQKEIKHTENEKFKIVRLIEGDTNRRRNKNTKNITCRGRKFKCETQMWKQKLKILKKKPINSYTKVQSNC